MTSHEFPQRSPQHISESESYKLFNNSLPSQWILRPQDVNDYGIDCEVELVSKTGHVVGKILKAQIKGRESVKFTAKGTASVGGIKQTTLRYWIELSRRVSVVAVLTDKSSERVFFCKVFWQAVALIDESEKNKVNQV